MNTGIRHPRPTSGWWPYLGIGSVSLLKAWFVPLASLDVVGGSAQITGNVRRFGPRVHPDAARLAAQGIEAVSYDLVFVHFQVPSCRNAVPDA